MLDSLLEPWSRSQRPNKSLVYKVYFLAHFVFSVLPGQLQTGILCCFQNISPVSTIWTWIQFTLHEMIHRFIAFTHFTSNTQGILIFPWHVFFYVYFFLYATKYIFGKNCIFIIFQIITNLYFFKKYVYSISFLTVFIA